MHNLEEFSKKKKKKMQPLIRQSGIRGLTSQQNQRKGSFKWALRLLLTEQIPAAEQPDLTPQQEFNSIDAAATTIKLGGWVNT